MPQQLNIFDITPPRSRFYEGCFYDRPKKEVFIGEWVYYEHNIGERLIGKVIELEDGTRGIMCNIYLPENQRTWSGLTINTYQIYKEYKESDPLPIRRAHKPNQAILNES